MIENEVGLVLTIGEKALVCGQLHVVGVALDLVDVSVLMEELTANTIAAVASGKEDFAVLLSFGD